MQLHQRSVGRQAARSNSRRGRVNLSVHAVATPVATKTGWDYLPEVGAPAGRARATVLLVGSQAPEFSLLGFYQWSQYSYVPCSADGGPEFWIGAARSPQHVGSGPPPEAAGVLGWGSEQHSNVRAGCTQAMSAPMIKLVP